jgi:hypothetical protein
MIQYLKVFVVFVLVLCGVVKASADGCALNYATQNEVIYYGLLAGTRNFGSPIAYNNSNPAYQTACPKYDYNSAIANSSTCRINGASSSAFRYIPTFNFVACPIDDYLPVILLLSGAVGFFIIRSKLIVGILHF